MNVAFGMEDTSAGDCAYRVFEKAGTTLCQYQEQTFAGALESIDKSVLRTLQLFRNRDGLSCRRENAVFSCPLRWTFYGFAFVLLIVAAWPIGCVLTYLKGRFNRQIASVGRDDEEGNAFNDVAYDMDLAERTEFFTKLVGVLERILYFISLSAQFPAGIGIVLGVKTAAVLGVWQRGDRGRAKFNVWLTGNLLSVIATVLAFLSVRGLLNLLNCS